MQAPRHPTALLCLALASCATPRPTEMRKPIGGTALASIQSEPGNFTETVGVRAGGMFASAFRTQASLSSDGGASTSIRFEDDLSLDDNTDALRAELYWRIDRRHRIDVGYFDLDRNGTRSIDRQIQWGDTSFDVGVDVTSRLRTQVFPVRYTYYFLADDESELGFSAGVYGMSLTASLSGIGTVNGTTGTSQATETFETPVPLPVVGLQGAYALSSDLRAIGSLQAFYVRLENIAGADVIDGGLLDLILGLEYDLTENFELGAAANWFYLNAGAERDRLTFDFDYGFAGLYVYVAARI